MLDEKYIRGVRHFLIRWKGYEPESDTWEPESTLNCAELIADFKTKQKKKGKNKTKPVKAKKGREREDSSDQATWDENEDFEVIINPNITHKFFAAEVQLPVNCNCRFCRICG